MRILVLDDEQYRHDGFAMRFAGQDVTHVRTVAEAFKALDGERFEMACLDHDLGSGDGTGLDVAERIAAMTREARPRYVLVHSFNPPGARRMVATLKQAGIPSKHEPYRGPA
jgi:ActR/RegA family two-component response regulator